MSVRTLTFSILAGLILSLGCRDRVEHEVRNGTLVISAPDTLLVPVAGSLTVTGLDHPLRARVALPREPGHRVYLPLPVGLYALEWIGDPVIDAGPDELSAPAFARRGPEWVVIASGQVSAVHVRVRDKAIRVPPNVSASRVSLNEAKLALR
jgi:hypothetical protein